MGERSEKHHGFLALAEMIQHKRVLTAVAGLVEEMRPDSDGAKRLNEWLMQYRVAAEAVFPTLGTLPSLGERVPLDFRIAFDRANIHAVRPRLIEASLHLIVLLTPKGKESS
jgi:hypothetical protein